MLTTDQKGAIAETAIAHAAIKLGIGVYKPVSDGDRYDLIFDVNATLLRIQCKWARRHGDVVVIRCYSARRTRDGLRRRTYSAAEVDAIVAYCPDVDRCYFVAAERFDGHAKVRLRLEPCRNNQRSGVNWAGDFLFDSLDLLEIQGP